VLSRLFSVLLSLLLLLTVGGCGALLILRYADIKNSHVIWEIFLILLPVNAVIVWLNWQAIRRLSRYGGHPFQIRRSYHVRLFQEIEATVGPIVIEGPALLIVSSSVAGTQISFRDIARFDGDCCRRFPHGQRECDFLLENSGTTSLMLCARPPKVLATSFQLLATPPPSGIPARLGLEIRGHCRVLQIPQEIEEAGHGFPVVIRNPQ